MSGAAMEAIRPIPAAAPVPVPRRWVGKISGSGREGTPRAEVEEGEQASGEDNEYLGVCHAVASRCEGGAEQEGRQGCSSAPLSMR